MPLFSRAKKTILLGIYLHQDRLSMVKLSRSKHITTLEAFAIRDLPLGWSIDEEPTRIIKKLVKEMRAENAYTALGFPASQVITKRIRLAAFLSEVEREVDVFNNLGHYFPGINEPLHVDFIKLSHEAEEDDVLLVAARREQVNAYIAFAEQAELKVRVVDVDVYAIARAMNLTEVSEPLVVLDVDVNAAQLILVTRGMATSVQPITMSQDTDSLIQQLKRGISLFSASLPSSQIKKLILTGKRAYFGKISQLLQDELQITAEISQVFRQLKLSEHIHFSSLYLHEPELLVALGLAIRSFPEW